MKLKSIGIVVLIIIGALIFISCTGKHTDIPEDLIGIWTTSESRYADRFFEITKERLIYGLGGDKKDIYSVSSIEESLEGSNIIYTINCKNTDGFKFTRSFYYESADGGVIRFKNQKQVKWTKVNMTHLNKI
jgi:hypothetical protein